MRYWSVLVLVLLGAHVALAANGTPTTQPADYHFAAGDVIEVTVTPQHNFDRTVTVQPDGKISYPLIGQLQAAGLTVAQLVQKLHDELNRELVDPIVTVALKEAGTSPAWKESGVRGRIREP